MIDNLPTYKVCPSCGVELPISYFKTTKTSGYETNARCKGCIVSKTKRPKPIRNKMIEQPEKEPVEIIINEGCKTCKICGQEFLSLSSLHLHLTKTEATTQQEYYEKYFPKYDPYNGRSIPFKNYLDYSERNFIDKKSEFSFILKEGFENSLANNLVFDQLKKCSDKSKGRFPNYCEWRSSKNIKYDRLLEKGLFGDFVSLFSKKIGGEMKFNYFPDDLIFVDKDSEILIDTREQKPLFFGPRTTVNVGDYTLSKENYNGVHIDRKSKADFIGTFTSGLARFKKECQKAKQMDIYLVVLVEECFSDCFRYRPLKFTKQIVGGENAFHGVRQITRQFENIQFLFVKDRIEARRYIKLVLNNKEIIKNYDLQFLYETGRLK